MVKAIVKLREEGADAHLAADLVQLFAGDLNPVAPKAQRKVPVPEGLNLDEWINEPPSEKSESEMSEDREGVDEEKGKKKRKRKAKKEAVEGGAQNLFLFGKPKKDRADSSEKRRPDPTPEELQKVSIINN